MTIPPLFVIPAPASTGLTVMKRGPPDPAAPVNPLPPVDPLPLVDALPPARPAPPAVRISGLSDPQAARTVPARTRTEAPQPRLLPGRELDRKACACRCKRALLVSVRAAGSP